MSERLFNDAELLEMGRRTLDRLNGAIEGGDTESALKLATRMYNEFLAMHDLYRNWIAATLSAVGREFGDEKLEAIMYEGVRAWWKPILETLPSDPTAMRTRIKKFVAGLQGHGGYQRFGTMEPLSGR